MRREAASGIETLNRSRACGRRRAGGRGRDRAHAPPAAYARKPQAAGRANSTRNPAIVGPLDVYYYDYFADIPGADLSKTALAEREDGDVIAYEAFNLADGKRSVSEIRDILGRYGAAPLPAVAAYFDVLARAGAVRFSP